MRAVLIVCAIFASSCVGSTGGEVIDFPTAAAGPIDAPAGQPLAFSTDTGWQVALSRTVLHIGGVYLNQARAVSGAQTTDCFLPGTYVAQETAGLDVDLLSPTPQPFPTFSHGTTLPVLVAQVWLTGVRVDEAEDTTKILQIAGTATREGVTQTFTGVLHIGSNRQAQGGTLPGAYPICKQRIVTPIDAPLVVKSTGGLLVRIDPRRFFIGVDFGGLKNSTFSDDSSDKPSTVLYQNLHAAELGGPYTVEWSDAL